MKERVKIECEDERFFISVDGKIVFETDHDSVGWFSMDEIEYAVESVVEALDNES